MFEIDIILPLYHPKAGWHEHVSEGIHALQAYFKGKALLHFIISDDGSGDGYFQTEKLEQLRQAADRFTFLSYPQNHGKGYCIRYAAKQCQGDFVLYTDGDFPFGWQGIADAVEKLQQGVDVVMGVRKSEYAKAISPWRKVLSGSVRRMNRILLGLPAEYLDTQAGLKGFNRRGLQAFLAAENETFIFDTEFILIAWNHDLKIATVPISLRPGLSFSAMGLRVVLRELRCFLRIFWKYRVLRKKIPTLEKSL